MNGQEGPRLQPGSRECSYANTQNVIPNRKRRNKEVFQSRMAAASKSGSLEDARDEQTALGGQLHILTPSMGHCSLLTALGVY